ADLGEKSDLAENIRNRKIFNKYNVLFPEDINKVFTDNPHLFLVTDKLNDFKAIKAQLDFPNKLNRILVEVFSYKSYKRALINGFKYPMLCVWDKKGLEKVMGKIRQGRIKIITLWAATITEAPELLIEALNLGVTIFAFTSNDVEFIEQNLNKTVTGFYTDTVIPTVVNP
ncbi:MAG: hypothetical protein ACRCTY_01245, partial [Candidatus Adiutrix sp.]